MSILLRGMWCLSQIVRVYIILARYTIYKVQELRGNIRVFCRCRFDSSGVCALKFDASGLVVCSTAQGRKKAYDFEKIFPPDTTQDEVYQYVY